MLQTEHSRAALARMTPTERIDAVIEHSQGDRSSGRRNEFASIVDGVHVRSNDVLEPGNTTGDVLRLRPGRMDGYRTGVDPYDLTAAWGRSCTIPT